MKKLKNISLQYEDGTSQNIGFNNLDVGTQMALVRAGLCDPPPEISSAKHYLILQWKDGWKEVLAINSDTADLIRYYVIRRIEDRGRIALDVGSQYPELTILERRPADLSRMLIVGDGSVKSYELQAELESYEGIFEAGGKREYKKYDKSNPYFKHSFSEGHEGISGIENSITEILKKKNLDSSALLSMDQVHRMLEYKEIAGLAGLKGSQKQSDVYGFIELILKGLTSQKNDL
jgi:hypothetical protein